MKHRELGYLLRISRCFDSYRRQQLRDTDLYPALLSFVSNICRFPGSTQDALADNLCADKTTVAHHLARLEEKGYIQRRVSTEDARCRLVYPTKKAMDLYPQLQETYQAFYEGLLKNLSPEDRETMERLSQVLCGNAKQMVKRGSSCRRT